MNGIFAKKKYSDMKYKKKIYLIRKEGVSKCIPSFFMTKPRLSQAEALLLPKDFVSLSISKVIWQRYIFVLTIPIKSSFSHKE